MMRAAWTRNPWAADREQGSRDWRLMPSAAVLWLTMIMCSAVPDEIAEKGTPPWLAIFLAVAILLIAGIICCLIRLAGRRSRRSGLLGQAVMLLLTIVVAMCAIGAHRMVEIRSTTHELLAASKSIPAEMTVRIREPPLTSDRRSADCRADATVESIAVGNVVSADYASIRVYATQNSCALRQDGLYAISGVLERPEYGSAKAWITVDDGVAPSLVDPPGTVARLVYAMQSAFIRNTQLLDEQGSILVPGITLGLPGQDVADPSMRAWQEPADPVYAQQVEDSFQAAGIMHLMAVSGGHFVIIAGLARRLCAAARAPRGVTACAVLGVTVMLMRVMVPAESVNRAACMGVIGVCALLKGRRGQGMSMLCLTVIGILMVFPDTSVSMGFALSCVAVLGIIWWSGALRRICERHMPVPVAQALSVTLSAQALALPVSVLMEPELPALSIVANLLVGPIVTVTTLLGLASLAVSWWWPGVGYALAWLASGGTRVMERIAWWCAHTPLSVIPWFSGPVAAIALLAVEGALAAAVRAWIAHHYGERIAPASDAVSGFHSFARVARPVQYAPGVMQRMREWMSETLRMLSSDKA